MKAYQQQMKAQPAKPKSSSRGIKKKTAEYFKDKIIVITGAGSGIGKALAEEISLCAPRKMILADINNDALSAAQQSIPQAAIGLYRIDVSSEKSMQEFFQQIFQEHDHIDVVFNNAGIAYGGEFQSYSFHDWQHIIKVNLWGIIYGTTFAYRKMLFQKHGHIVNTASLGGLIPGAISSAYVATKFAVVGLTTSLREEAHHYGVKVSVVCPGVIRTGIFKTAHFVGNVDREKLKQDALEHGAISAAACAREIMSGVMRNKGIILVRATDHLFWLLQRISPMLISPINQMKARHFRENFKKPEIKPLLL